MSGPVNKIKFRQDSNGTLNRSQVVLIDGELLSDLIESAAKSWADKSKALLNLKALRRSSEASGEFEILICANCAASGYVTSGDIGLKPFRVTHDGDYVIWNIDLPSSTETSGILEFRFHRPQYAKAIGAISE